MIDNQGARAADARLILLWLWQKNHIKTAEPLDFISIFNSAIDNHDLDKVSYNAIKRVLENNSIDDLVNLESQDLKELSV